jgi:hypothetical protein
MASIWGVVLHELIEFGVGHKYNTLFDEMAGAATYTDAAGANALAFGATDEILVGVDASKDAFIRAIARNADTGGTFQALPDDQWNLNRLDKAGFYGSLDEGRVCIDSRAVAGLILKA